MDKILIVEDQPLELGLLDEILSEAGYSTLTAQDGLQARDLLSEPIASLKAAVLDWVMPRMDGIELLEWMKGQTHPSRILASAKKGGFSRNFYSSARCLSVFRVCRGKSADEIINEVGSSGSDF